MYKKKERSGRRQDTRLSKLKALNAVAKQVKEECAELTVEAEMNRQQLLTQDYRSVSPNQSYISTGRSRSPGGRHALTTIRKHHQF